MPLTGVSGVVGMSKRFTNKAVLLGIDSGNITPVKLNMLSVLPIINRKLT
jgi:hypothetical protein